MNRAENSQRKGRSTTHYMPRNFLSAETFQRVSHYSSVTGKSMKEAINTAVCEWMDEYGDDIILEIEDRQRRQQKARGKKKASSQKAAKPDPKASVVWEPKSEKQYDGHFIYDLITQVEQAENNVTCISSVRQTA